MKYLLAVVSAVVIAGAAWWIFRPAAELPPGPYVTIGSVVIPVEIAGTPELQTRGLSGRTSLPDNGGMLFVYDTPGPRAYWMKDMRFPIDIIWIGGNLQVAGITVGAEPESYPETFSPPGQALHVLEVNSGFAERNGIQSGDSVQLNLD